MQGATRLLVSHQRQFLPKCGRLIVLRGGRIVADGSFQQLQSLGYEAELGSGQGSGQAAELDDTAYDQEIGHSASVQDSAASSAGAAVRAGDLGSAAQHTSSSTTVTSLEPADAKSALTEQAPGMPEQQSLVSTERQGPEHTAAEAMSQTPVQTTASHGPATGESPGAIDSNESSVDLHTKQGPAGAKTVRVHIPSSAFQSERPDWTQADGADSPGAGRNPRGLLSTLSSRLSRLGRRRSGPATSLSGRDSVGAQLRVALSRCVAY